MRLAEGPKYAEVSQSATNLYSALLDFTVESTGPVFTPLTDRLSDHEELRA